MVLFYNQKSNSPTISSDTLPLKIVSTSCIFSSFTTCWMTHHLTKFFIIPRTRRTPSCLLKKSSTVLAPSPVSNKASPYILDTNFAMLNHPSPSTFLLLRSFCTVVSMEAIQPYRPSWTQYQ